MRFDALLLLSFGGPERPEDVGPFLANVLRGRPVSPERVEQVASQYMLFGGRSPINDQNRALIEAMRAEMAANGRDLPVYWGNRNWSPYLADTVAAMRDDGIRRAAVFATSAYSSYSGCRQYLADLEAAAAAAGPGAPQMVKVRTFHDHPGFVEPLVEGLRRILSEADSADTVVLMTAHSIPESSAAGCDYRAQLEETAGLVASGAGLSPGSWRLVYQSRSGVPGQPWLGPDVVEAIDNLPAGTGTVLVAPIGFVSDHMEVVFDLDTQARQAAEERGLRFLRAPTPGVHPRFVQMVRELVEELEDPPGPALALGAAGPRPVPCRAGCCPAPQRHPSGPGR